MTIINKVIKGKNYFKKFSFILLIIPFLFLGIKASFDLSANTSIDILKDFLNFGPNDNGINVFLSVISFKFLFVFSPIIFFTFFEIFIINSGEFQKASFHKLNSSKGYKYADIWYYIGNLIHNQFSFIITFLTLGISVFNSKVFGWFHEIYTKFIPVSTSPIIIFLIICLAILGTDFILYWQHRLEHTIPFVWDFHEFHHSATEMTILSKDRYIPLQTVLPQFILLPLGVLIGLLLKEYVSQGYFFPFIMYAAYKSLDFFQTVVGHSSSYCIYPKPLSYFIMSPTLHWLHHSDNPDHYDCNFGMNFAIWDRMFGTYLDESNLKDIKAFGVPGTDYNNYHPLYVLTLLPIKKLIKRTKLLLQNAS